MRHWAASALLLSTGSSSLLGGAHGVREQRIAPRLMGLAVGVTAIALLAFIPLAGAGGCGDKRFTVHAWIVRGSLDSTDYQKRGMFWAETTVTNVSGINQKIVVWSQYGWSWLSNNEAVQPGIEAAQNIATRSVLRPGQKYVAKVELFANPRFRRPLTFRLGFYPTPERPISGMKSATNQIVSWSDDVVLDK